MLNPFVRKLIDDNEICRSKVDKINTHAYMLCQICTIKNTSSYQIMKKYIVKAHVKSDLEIELDNEMLSLENLLKDNLICETESKLFNYKIKVIDDEVKVEKKESFLERVLSERMKEKKTKEKEKKNLHNKQINDNLIFEIMGELGKRLRLPINTQILTKKMLIRTLDLKDITHMSLAAITKRNLKRKLPEIVDIHYPKYSKIKRM